MRMLSVDMIERAKSGHPGLPLGAAPMLYTLFQRHLKFHPTDPQWRNRDRFILSAGHGSALLYSALHLYGYDVTIEDLKAFRQVGSKTPGHPEYGHTPGVEATTGPLGQGLAMGVGMALAEAHLAEVLRGKNGTAIDHYTYVLAGDGCLMEGISHEAASFAGSHRLRKLIVLYDSNRITIEGDTQITFCDDTRKRFAAYGWNTILVEDGNDIALIDQAIQTAKASDRPTLIEVRTTIGYAAGTVAGTAAAHGAPIGSDNRKVLVDALGYTSDPFAVDRDVLEHVAEARARNARRYEEELEEMSGLFAADLELKKRYGSLFDGDLSSVDFCALYNAPAEEATRSSSGRAIQEMAKAIPGLVGGSADLGPSNNSEIKGSPFMKAGDCSGRNIHFGVREFAMAAISNGLALHGGLCPYCATFFVFSDYMKAAIRLSALMKTKVIYILTHDSIGVGEDGPTHEPIEQLAMLRSIPGLQVIRPADANETMIAWQCALSYEGPTALILTRQKLRTLDIPFEEAWRGAYIASPEREKLDGILLATGSEVGPALEAQSMLFGEGIDVRVVSMPSWEIFAAQDEAYRERILPKDCSRRVSFEALSTFGWSRWVPHGAAVGLDRFGLSGKGEELFRELGMTAEAVCEAMRHLIRDAKHA